MWDYLEKSQGVGPRKLRRLLSDGRLHYHLAQLSGVARWITSLFITAGDREKGLKELELAAEKGLAAEGFGSIQFGFRSIPVMKNSRLGLCPLAKRLKEKYPEQL